jgi:hypothetical protein
MRRRSRQIPPPCCPTRGRGRKLKAIADVDRLIEGLAEFQDAVHRLREMERLGWTHSTNARHSAMICSLSSTADLLSSSGCETHPTAAVLLHS